MDQIVLREDRQAVAVLTINRPERLNAFNRDVASEIIVHLEDLTNDPSIRAVIITGAGTRAFCAGADLKDERTHAVDGVADHLAGLGHRTVAEFLGALLTFRKPIICAVHGYAVGIGFQFQLCCDIILAATTARFQLPQVALGIMPAYGGAPRLAQWVGRGRAAEIALTGRVIEALEAERIGLVAQVCPPEDLMSRALELSTQIAQSPPHSLALTKESLRESLEGGSLHAASEADTYRFMILSMTEESGSRHEGWRQGSSPEPS